MASTEAAAAAATTAGAKVATPVAARIPHTIVFGRVEGENHGTNPMHPTRTLEDDLFWLRDDERKNEQVLAHLQAENEYAKSLLDHLNTFQEDLFQELKSHLKETSEKVPYADGPFYYYVRTEEGKGYKIHCRKNTAEIGRDGEEVVLDENVVAEGHKFCSVGDMSPSPSHTLLAYSTDTSGDERYNIYVKNIATGELIRDSIEDTDGGVEWGVDDRFLYYGKQDKAHRPFQVWRHEIGTDVATDELLYEEPNELFWLGFHTTRSGRYLVITSGSKETSEAHIVDLTADNGKARPVLFAARTAGVKYTFDHRGDSFYIRTNNGGVKNFQVVTCPVTQTAREHWTPLPSLPYDPQRFIGRVFCLRDIVCVAGREGGMTQVWILLPDEANVGNENAPVLHLHRVEFGEAAYTVQVSTNKKYDAEFVRLSYSSLVTPQSTIDYYPFSRTLTVRKEEEVPLYDRTHYATKSLEVTARDGTKVPVSMVYRKDLHVEGHPSNLLLYGYGSYGLCMDAAFDYTRLPLLDRGMVFAIAHIRGGGEMGRSWYEDEGKYLKKKNTFNDFCDVAEHLVSSGWTTPQQQVCWGRSAGGLLIGATINQRPDLFRAALAGVPFVDIMATMSDPIIPLTVVEWEEWGNPHEEKYFDYMLSYSPMNNIKNQAYPAVLVTAGLNDPRVPYWECAKWVARLRDATTGASPIAIKTDLDAGHFSASDRYKHLRERAFDFSWVLDQLGLAKAPQPYPSA